MALAPLAVLSMGWTAALVAPVMHASVVEVAPLALPAVEIPDIETELIAPASGTRPAPASRGGALAGVSIVEAVSTQGIPAAALAAYQRAEAVMAAADSACHVPWELLAGIGRVESDHGRYGGSHLDADGIARPAIIGIALNGHRHTSAISDTDAGRLDGDLTWDRAVGPMQFIPSTWSVVGVDADGDGRRDPQDIDDAALAAGVYLCAGDGDLSTTAGREAALLRYNHSPDYVRLVLALYTAYSKAVPIQAMALRTAVLLDAEAIVAASRAAARNGQAAPADPTPVAPSPEPPASEDPDLEPTDPTDPTPSPPDECVPTASPTEEPTAEPTEPACTTPDPDPVPDPTPDPTPEPSPEPVPEPTPDPDPVPEPTPEPTPEPDPAPDPTTEPTTEPSTEPTTGTTTEPTTDPTGEPTTEPSAEPTP